MRARWVGSTCWLAFCSGFFLGCEPLLAVSLGVPTVSVEELSAQLGGPRAPQLIDVRSREAYGLGHLPGAAGVELGALDQALEQAFERNRPAVMICEHGRASLFAGSVALGHGYRQVKSLAGGTAAWKARGLPVEGGLGRMPAMGELRQEMGRVHQLIAWIGGTVIKPTYMLAALVLALWLWRARKLSHLRWGLLVFFLGEAFCAANFYLGRWGLAMPLDLVHGAGMVGAGALVPWAAYRVVDRRILHLSHPTDPCSVVRFCGRCHKRDPVPCGIHRVFLCASACLGLLFALPLTGPVRSSHAVASVFGSRVDYGAPLLNQLIELRLYALLGTLSMFGVLAGLIRGPARTARVEAPFFLGFGLGSFALFRYLLRYAYWELPVWSDFWEEVTELMMVAGVAIVLWVFRRQLELAPERAASGE